jgi:antitoxin (DNA-binding transcriptional repressor) of toxin-antitoxin stability system
MSRDVVHVSEAEAAANFAGVLARIRAGIEVVIENDHRPLAVVSPADNGKTGELAGTVGAESEEMGWLRSHTSELDQYAGEWLLIVGHELAAHDKDIKVRSDRPCRMLDCGRLSCIMFRLTKKERLFHPIGNHDPIHCEPALSLGARNEGTSALS